MTTHEIASRDDRPIRVDVGPTGPSRAVILCHGFKGHRRWGFIPDLARRLGEAGILAVAMDFSLGGHGPDGGPAFPHPDRFRRNTIARERDDLARVIRWVRQGAGGAASGLGLWGHSRGGVAVVLAALEDETIPAIVTWSTAAHPDFYTARQKARWRKLGGYEFKDAETGTPLVIGVEYLDDIERNAVEYDLGGRAGTLAAAHLVVHGEQDLVIPVADADVLARGPGARSEKELLRLRTGHTFGYGRGAPSKAYQVAAASTVEWFDRRLPEVTQS
jgi:dienelactone hydrolase